jgi:toxin ParE1/3/4
MVKWTDHALAQLHAIHDYISQDSPFYAKRVAEEIVYITLSLDELPQLGRMVPKLMSQSVREIFAVFVPNLVRDQNFPN